MLIDMLSITQLETIFTHILINQNIGLVKYLTFNYDRDFDLFTISYDTPNGVRHIEITSAFLDKYLAEELFTHLIKKHQGIIPSSIGTYTIDPIRHYTQVQFSIPIQGGGYKTTSTRFSDEEIEQAFQDTFQMDIDDLLRDPFDEVTKPNGCLHKNKKKVTFNTFEYWYCPDCKKEIKE